MANTKEAIAIVVDVGPSMNQAPAGTATYLQTSLDAVNAILQRKLFAESKDEVALILFGTTDTANELADGESYEHISVARPMGVANWELLQYLQNDVQPSDVSGDFLDAIVVAMDHLVKGIEGKKGFGSKRLILFSDVGGEFSDDQIDDIVASMKEAQVEFNVIGPSLDDDDDDDENSEPKPGPSNGHVKEKTAQQRAGEAMLNHIIRNVDGDSYSFSEALPALAFFQSRQVRSVAWKAQLDIGTCLQIPVAGYQKMKEAKAKSFKNVYAKDIDAPIERIRTYHLNDEDRTEVEKEDTVEGHRYGSTLVPFSSDDKEAFKFQTEKGLKVLGFTKMENIKRHKLLGDYTMAFSAEKGDQAAAVALSAFINALYETNSCAIVRRVYAKNTKVQLGCLVPHIKAKYECLFYNEIPFAEDVRQYTFSSLPLRDDIEANKKLKPSEEQLDLMDELINTMDLSKADKDEDGDTKEALKPKLTFNPYLQRLYQCLQHRAMNPDDQLPELNATIANYLKPPQEVQTQCEPTIKKMKDKLKLVQIEKKKEDKAGGNIFKDDKAGGDEPPVKKQKVDDSLDGGMADLVKAKVTEVGTVNPVDDFKAMVADKEEDRFEEACKQMQKRVVQIVMDSFGTQSYGKAMDCLKALREHCIKNGEPKQFNEFLGELKVSVKDKGRKDFWEEVVTESVSLIHKAECEDSGVSKQESEEFLKEKEEPKHEEKKQEDNVDDQDLLDDF